MSPSFEEQIEKAKEKEAYIAYELYSAGTSRVYLYWQYLNCEIIKKA